MATYAAANGAADASTYCSAIEATVTATKRSAFTATYRPSNCATI